MLSFNPPKPIRGLDALSSPPDPEKTKVVEEASASSTNDAPAGNPATGAGADSSPVLPDVTVAVTGTPSRQTVPSTGPDAAAAEAMSAPVSGAAVTTTQVVVAPKPWALKIKNQLSRSRHCKFFYLQLVSS